VDLASLNLDDLVIVILGKGDRPGAIPFGRNTEVCQMIDRCTRLTTEQRAGERTVACSLAIASRVCFRSHSHSLIAAMCTVAW
jgi:hypothetical protein